MPAPKGHAPYPGCEKGGKPKVHTKEFIDSEADALEEWMKKKDNIFYQTFCYERGYSKNRLPEWALVNDKFAVTYAKSRDRQEGMLLHGALTKKYCYNAAALVLSHSYGMHAKTEQTISGDSSNPLAWIINSVDGNTRNLVDEEKKE